jgi:hypothetical protein
LNEGGKLTKVEVQRQERGRLAREFLWRPCPDRFSGFSPGIPDGWIVPVAWPTFGPGRGSMAKSRFDQVNPSQPRSTQVNPNNIYNIYIMLQIQTLNM